MQDVALLNKQISEYQEAHASFVRLFEQNDMHSFVRPKVNSKSIAKVFANIVDKGKVILETTKTIRRRKAKDLKVKQKEIKQEQQDHSYDPDLVKTEGLDELSQGTRHGVVPVIGKKRSFEMSALNEANSFDEAIEEKKRAAKTARKKYEAEVKQEEPWIQDDIKQEPEEFEPSQEATCSIQIKVLPSCMLQAKMEIWRWEANAKYRETGEIIEKVKKEDVEMEEEVLERKRKRYSRNVSH